MVHIVWWTLQDMEMFAVSSNYRLGLSDETRLCFKKVFIIHLDYEVYKNKRT